MKNILLLFTFFMSFSAAFCQSEQQERNFFIIAYEQGSDTLFVHSDKNNADYVLLWKGDTIFTEWSYSSIANSISSLGAFGCYNTFLLTGHAGDGCPSTYSILAIKADGSYFLSDRFGNCNEIATFNYKGQTLEFSFSALHIATTHRPKTSVRYNSATYTLE